MQPEKILRLNLLENAYDYLNSSLEFVVKAKKTNSQKEWKFAIISLAHCIELLLKERLRLDHELLIYANIDRYRPITRETKTASWDVLIDRNKYVLGEDFVGIDAGRLKLVQKMRNQMVHYDVELHFPQVYHDYANILNFVIEYHKKFLSEFTKDDLHQNIDADLRSEEVALITTFNEEVVYFNGVFMRKDLQEEIVQEQQAETLTIAGVEYERLRYGSTEELKFSKGSNFSILCHDCAVSRGQIHLFGCDMEICPKCGGQLISCTCDVADWEDYKLK